MDITDKGIERDAKIIAVRGRIDGTSADDLQKQLLEWIGQGHIKMIVDMGELDYISSAGLRSILVASKDVKSKNGKLMLCALKSSVKEVFDISGFNLIIPIYESVEAALEKM